ncbi:MAG TPA: tetratricopeptide repeat protein [Alphaproteobacteria bacterium]|nr:tetratricopeptide repeat protein [Alphaproteobacteria bacterium]
MTKRVRKLHRALLSAAATALFILSISLGPAPALAQSELGRAATTPSPWTIDSDPGSLSDPAEHGDAAAQYALGMKLWLGRGMKRDTNAAIVWLTRSAAQDYPLAESALGVMYEDGDGVHQDFAKAAFYYARAAQSGEPLGQYRLGLLYLNGRGVARDTANAARWFRAAAEQGMAEAQNNLGYLYAMGMGVAKDPQAALAWYQKAAQAGNTEAKANLVSLQAQMAAAPSPQAQRRPPDLKDIVATLEAHPLDSESLTAEFGKPGALEIKSEPSEDGRLEEVRVGFAQTSGRSWLSYKIYPSLSTAQEAFEAYGRTPLPAGSTLVRHAFTVGLMSNNRPFTVRCVESRDSKGPPEEHEVSCAFFEGDMPLVYVGGTLARYQQADYPPDEIWKRAGTIAAAGYWHAHRVLPLDRGAGRGG